jgi:sphingolipid 4-desaturase/C4-monooxygenase
VFFLVAWIYGGAANHALSLMTHELSHNLVFKSKILNDYFGIFCNVAMAIPSSTMFKRYHMEHHIFQGNVQKDTDLPTVWEGRFFTNTLLKAIWLLFQPAFYAIRPSVVNPKILKPLDWVNVVVTDFLIAAAFGPRAVLYLVLSTLLGMGFHPVAGHFIAEHYVFVEGHETYSYYGSLNWICWNVGYHNEHHDFPKVPGWRLPQVKAIAPEFYDKLPQHKSWTYVLWRYVTDPSMGPFRRVLRRDKVTKQE